MYTALGKLGYKSYHMVEAGKNRHANYWLEALTAKVYGTGKGYGKAEFDKLLKEYSAITDAPCACFPDELVAAYPNAKVVLTTREPDTWVQSMERTYYTILAWRVWPLVNFIDPNRLGAFHDLLRLIPIHWASPGDWQDRSALRRGFQAHNDHVRSLVPKENLLEFRPQEGWEPLCTFLGKEVPGEPFPRVNEGGYAVKLVMVGVVIRMSKLAMVPVLGGVVAWLAWRYMLITR